jgi:predicted peptidase
MKKITFYIILSILFLMACTNKSAHLVLDKAQNLTPSEPTLVRQSYLSSVDQSQREYFVYLPRGYHTSAEKKWPVMLFLHGNGERGNGQDELDFVLMQGPLYEAWVQKKRLAFHYHFTSVTYVWLG